MPELAGCPPTAILRKAGRLKAGKKDNMRGLSLASHLEDRKNGHKPQQGGGVVGSGPWLFNTSQTAGTFISDDRMKVPAV